jgi:ATP-binding cassette subfamily B protein
VNDCRIRYPARKPPKRLGSLRALWPFVRRHRGLFGAWLLALAVSSAATLSLPQAVKQMIDHGFSGGGQINRPSPCCSWWRWCWPATAASISFAAGRKGRGRPAQRLYAHLIQLVPASTTAAAAANWSRA